MRSPRNRLKKGMGPSRDSLKKGMGSPKDPRFVSFGDF